MCKVPEFLLSGKLYRKLPIFNEYYLGDGVNMLVLGILPQQRVHGLTTGTLVELVVPDEMAADIRLIKIFLPISAVISNYFFGSLPFIFYSCQKIFHEILQRRRSFHMS
jgi:hypothetical protein